MYGRLGWLASILSTRVHASLIMMYIMKNDFQNKRLHVFCFCGTLFSTCRNTDHKTSIFTCPRAEFTFPVLYSNNKALYMSTSKHFVTTLVHA